MPCDGFPLKGTIRILRCEVFYISSFVIIKCAYKVQGSILCFLFDLLLNLHNLQWRCKEA